MLFRSECKGIYQGEGTCQDILQGGNCGCQLPLPPCTNLCHFTDVFSISGRVLDASGRPICNVPVEFEYPSSEVVTFTTDKANLVRLLFIYLEIHRIRLLKMEALRLIWL